MAWNAWSGGGSGGGGTGSLKITGNVGLDATLRTIVDGEDTSSILQLSTAQVNIAPTPGNDATKPSLSFGDGNTGFYELSDNNLAIAIAGAAKWYCTADYFGDSDSTGPSLRNETCSVTNPTLLPYRNDPDTGIGGNGSNQLSLIAGGTEVARASNGGSAATTQLIVSPGATLGATATPSLAFGDGDTGFFEDGDDNIRVVIGATQHWSFFGGGIYGINTNGPLVNNAASAATTPTLIPDKADANTGLGGTPGDTDALSLIAGGVEVARASEGGSAATTQFIVSPGATLGGAATPSLAFGDGDSGIFEDGDDTLKVSLGTATRWTFFGNTILSANSNGAGIESDATSATNPTIWPDRGNQDTGVGAVPGADQLSLIAGGVEGIRLDEDGDLFVVQLTRDAVPADAVLIAGSACFYMDETAGNLMVKIKEEDGSTVKSGTVCAVA